MSASVDSAAANDAFHNEMTKVSLCVNPILFSVGSPSLTTFGHHCTALFEHHRKLPDLRPPLLHLTLPRPYSLQTRSPCLHTRPAATASQLSQRPTRSRISDVARLYLWTCHCILRSKTRSRRSERSFGKTRCLDGYQLAVLECSQCEGGREGAGSREV